MDRAETERPFPAGSPGGGQGSHWRGTSPLPCLEKGKEQARGLLSLKRLTLPLPTSEEATEPTSPETPSAPSASLRRTHRPAPPCLGRSPLPRAAPPSRHPQVRVAHAPRQVPPGPARAHLFPFPGESQPSAAPAGTGRSSRGSPPSPASRRSAAGEGSSARERARGAVLSARTSERLLCTAHGAWTRRSGGKEAPA